MIAEKVVGAIQLFSEKDSVIEIGPGEGVFTELLSDEDRIRLTLIELDKRLIPILKNRFPHLEKRIIEEDFLKINLVGLAPSPLTIIGNFPFNISSQILFKVIENPDLVRQLVGIFQKEVALRITAQAGNKTYGILSVLTQVYYQSTYLFDVPSSAFSPPPKVMGGTIKLVRNNRADLGDKKWKVLKQIVKTAFNQRRKKLNNALQTIPFDKSNIPIVIWDKRPERLSVEDYLMLLEYCLLIE